MAVEGGFWAPAMPSAGEESQVLILREPSGTGSRGSLLFDLSGREVRGRVVG